MASSAKILTISIALLLPNFVFLTPVPQVTSEKDAFVIVTTETNLPTETSTLNEVSGSPSSPPELRSMQVNCNVSNRYAHTVVSSRYKNPADIAQEAVFSIILPDTAFISGFSMQIKDKVYDAYVKEKEEAKKEYEDAVQSGLGAGYVEQNARDSNKFTVSVNVEPQSKVTFNLNYEELLVRKHGKYEMVLNLHPGQLVKVLTVDVNINETQKLVNVKTPALRTGNEIIEDNENNNNKYATISPVGEDGKCVKIHFSPNVQQQKEMAKKLDSSKKTDYNSPFGFNTFTNNNINNANNDSNGISGQFVIEYDVERTSKGGEVLVNNGYFVHFFAPPELKPLAKHAIFILDVSGSMVGRKIEQLKQAMLVILDELKPNDYFNLVEFSFGAKAWNFDTPQASPTFEGSRKIWWQEPEELTTPSVPLELPPAYPATAENKKKAKKIIEEMQAGGGTNIYDALQVGLNLSTAGVPEKENTKDSPQPIVIFLTDGDATDGETDDNLIYEMVQELNDDGDTAIFSLAFGYDANKNFLKKLSLKNNGFMRQIYEASDAALQLQDFYEQISSPLLKNVTFKYPEGQVESVTKQSFHTLFDGSEFVVAGKMTNSKDEILYVHGLSFDGPIDYPPIIIPIPNRSEITQEIGPLERLWAYMTIKQLLDKRDELETNKNNTEADNLKEKALNLALKYSFVTPITSLVVVKPNETEKAVNAEEAREGDTAYGGLFLTNGIALNAAVPLGLPPPNPSFASAYIGGGGGFGGGSFGGAGGYPSTPLSYRKQFLQPDMDMFVEPNFERVYLENIDFTTPMTQNNFDELPWLNASKTDPDRITINNELYDLGNNETLIETIPCTVDSRNGTCTLLSSCPVIYPKLESYDTYVQKYFCHLAPNFAGVCCTDTEN